MQSHEQRGSGRVRAMIPNALGALGLAVIGTAVSPSTNAQQADTTDTNVSQVEEIVVTAQRRSERLQDVPIAMTALNAGALQDAGISDVSELAQAVPGLSFNTQLGGLGEPRIRGVGVASNGPGVENPVATYIDGVYYGSAASNLFGLSDVSQVAVLKGPQGTLFGRNATGGLIQVTTKEPSQKFSADVEGTVGTKETFGANIFVTGGLSERLAGSVAVNLDDRDEGFGKNLYTGLDVQTHHSVATRDKLLFQFDDDTKIHPGGRLYEPAVDRLCAAYPRTSGISRYPSVGWSERCQYEYPAGRRYSPVWGEFQWPA